MARPSDRLTDDQVRLVLLAIGREKLGVTARRVDRTVMVVSRIQRGLKYRNVHPELPRRPGRPIKRKAPKPSASNPTCILCQHFTLQKSGETPCDLGFPDPLEEGLGFAEECNLYQMRR